MSRTVSNMFSSLSRRLKGCLGNDGFDNLIARALNCFDLDHQELEGKIGNIMDGIIDVSKAKDRV